MLRYRENRLDYGEQLKPPLGFQLNQAIAATYSLDLNTLLSIPVALHFAQTLDGDLSGERFQVLEAIERASQMVRVYCQKGQIHIPAQHNALYGFVDQMVIEVFPEGPFESFHPKVWILRYGSEGHSKIIYRVIVLSRNLTFDRSWDLAASFEGIPGRKIIKENQGLLKLLEYLNSNQPINNYRVLANELARVQFDPIDGFEGPPEFVVSGVDSSKPSVTIEEGNRLLIMSPFLHQDTLSDMKGAVEDGDAWLFSRSEELDTINPETINQFRSYAISSLVVDGERISVDGDKGLVEEMDEEGMGDIQDQNLHAKLFVFETEDKHVWHLGSANATKAAMERNVEFGIRLVGNDMSLTVAALLEQLLGTEEEPIGIFEEYQPATETNSEEQEKDRKHQNTLRRATYKILESLSKAKAVFSISSGSVDRYDLLLKTNLGSLSADSFKVSVKPFNTECERRDLPLGKKHETVFPSISETELSGFLDVRLIDGDNVVRKFLCKIPVMGMPETRLSKVFRKIIANQGTFFNYLKFLLQEDISKEELLSTGEPGERKSEQGDIQIWAQESELFEQLLVAASRNPAKLKDVERLIERVRQEEDQERKLLPDEFLEFWETFKTFIPASRKHSR